MDRLMRHRRGLLAVLFVLIASAGCGGGEAQSERTTTAPDTTTSFPRGVGRETKAYFVFADRKGRFPRKQGELFAGTATIREGEEGLHIAIVFAEDVPDGAIPHIHEGTCEEYDATRPVLAELASLYFGQSGTTVDITLDGLVGNRLIDLHHPKTDEPLACGFIVAP
jgi:hypothetical protein